MTSIRTIEEGIDYLQKRGFRSKRRDWAMGHSLFAFSGNSDINDTGSKSLGLYIYSQNEKWFVVVGQGQETEFPSLEAAVLHAEKRLASAVS